MPGNEKLTSLEKLAAGIPRPLAVYALTAKGAETARLIAKELNAAVVFLPDRLSRPDAGEGTFDRFFTVLAENFSKFQGHVVVAATGIVVRALAPILQSKTSDPAVVAMDQEGRWAVSLLSGHLGGANALAEALAGVTGGRAVITTATDSAGKPAVEVIVRDLGFKITNFKPLSRISRKILEGEQIPVYDPKNLLMGGLSAWPESFVRLEEAPSFYDESPHIWVGPDTYPFPDSWLLVRPPVFYLGMGCNRGTELGELQELVADTFKEHHLCISAIAGLASIDAKRDEVGLLALARELGVEFQIFSAGDLEAIQTPNPSATVEKHMGVKSVCEAAAMLAAGAKSLEVTKQKSKNATLAVARASWKSLVSDPAKRKA